MVKTMKTSLLVSFAAILLFTSCDPEKENPTPVDNSNGITLKFVGQIGGSDISKVSGAVAGNLPKLNADGSIADSGVKVNDAGTAATDLWSAEKTNPKSRLFFFNN